MNAVEIEEAISQLAEQEFDSEAFPFAFLEAFGNKATTLKRLKSGSSNASDVEGGVLQRNNIHIAVCEEGEVTSTLDKLKASQTTSKAKAKYVLATDGITFEAEDLNSGETIACPYPHFPDHFGFFLTLAGISTVKEIRNNAIDIKATGRLNRLYVELLKDNEDWATEARRHDMNQFMARLIFCFFAEDTDIFNGDDLFTSTVEQMSDSRSDNTQQVIAELFRAMDIKQEDRDAANLPRWACTFPWVNGGLFAGCKDIPNFSRIARSYLLHAGRLDWKEINPDIFGSMIQAVADDEERGELGMHYTSVPNILKVLNPLFLDDLREQLVLAGDNARKLLNFRKRISNIRVFDPACGSGNFLVIAYIRLREIEAEIVHRRGEPVQKSWIKLENFYGIELKDFAAEVARLSLLIAEFQCDVKLIGQKEAKALMLPLKNTGKIRQGNALRIDWLEVCPPTTSGVKLHSDDLFHTPLNQAEIDFDNQGGETYICGNPPYLGSTWQSKEQKNDLKAIFDGRVKSWKSLDYVAGWFMKAADYGTVENSSAAFVSTNSICQGQQVPILWPLIFLTEHEIAFAYTSFKWANLASHNAGVTVVIVGISKRAGAIRQLFSLEGDGETVLKKTANINAYLVPAANVEIEKRSKPISNIFEMTKGNQPTDGGGLLMTRDEVDSLGISKKQQSKVIRPIYGSAEFIRGISRYCLWIDDETLQEVSLVPSIMERFSKVQQMRRDSSKAATVAAAKTPHRFGEVRQQGNETVMIVPSVSSEARDYLPVGFKARGTIVSNLAFAMYDASLWNMALIASRIHLVWIATVCGKMKTDFRYSNTMGWNTFPVPILTEKNKADLTRCAEDILLAREAHYPATIADLYDPEKMPEDLRHAHERNDEVLERIYIGRRFKNDTERLEKLFELYTKMTASGAKPAAKVSKRKKLS